MRDSTHLNGNKFYKAALHYASLGWHVFPIKAGLKTPATKNGFKDATTDAGQIATWWLNNPNANVAVACGDKSGVYVVDIDVDESKGTDGFKSIQEAGLACPETVCQKTPRGGSHFFYVNTQPIGCKVNMLPGVDIRGNGGYVLLPPSISKDGGAYTWIASPGEVAFAVYPSGLVPPRGPAPWAGPPKAPETPTRTLPGTASASQGPNMTQRASAWLAAADGAVQGSGGHDKLYEVCQAMVNGFCLPRPVALDLLWREYNPKCVPPWDPGNKADSLDFVRKVDEAIRNGNSKPRGWLRDSEEYAPMEDDHLGLRKMIDNMLLKNQSKAAKKVKDAYRQEELNDSNELEYLCMPAGILGSITSWMNRNAMRSQPLLSLGCALTFLGVLYGRKVRDERDGRTNLYGIGVGGTSAGKDNGPKCIRKLCEMAFADELLGGCDLASDSSIETRVSNHPATLMMLDEVGHLLKAVKSGKSEHKMNIVKVLMQMYSRAGSTYLGREFADEEKQKKISQPCLSIWGTATPERFQEGISPDELADGWLSRCLVFTTDTVPEKLDVPFTDPPGDLVEYVHQWYKYEVTKEVVGPNLHRFQNPDAKLDQHEFVASDEAKSIFKQFNDESEATARRAKGVGPLWFKAEENARRIALILAAGDWQDGADTTILPDHAKYACRLIKYLVRSFIRNYARNMTENQHHEKQNLVLQIIASGKANGVLKRDIARKAKLPGRERDSILSDLLEADLVIKRTVSRSVRFWAEEYFAEYLESQNNE
jgi:hypothetical protein